MMPSSSSRRRRRRRNRNRPPPPPAPKTQAGEVTSDDAELPPSAVVHRLECIPFARPAPPNPNPPEAQPQPHGATHPSSTSSSRRRGGRRGHKGPAPAPAPAAEEARDWAGLLLDALCAILGKLDHVEILIGAGQVCRSWRRAARDVPALWRRIDMRGHADIHELDLCGMAQVAVRRSAGQCESFWGEYAAHEDLILFLGHQAPSLKSLRLISCHGVLIEGLVEAIKKFPLLEELELSLCSNIGSGNHMFEVGKACPQLRHLRMSKLRFYNLQDDSDGEDADSEFRYNRDDEAKGIATMLELRSLQLFANNLTNEGLRAILDNCIHLESLDMRHCFNVVMDDALRAKCSRIKTLRLPHDSTDDYDIEALSPIWPGLGIGVGSDSDSDDDCWYGGPDYILDSDEYDDYCDPERYLDGVYIGRRVTLMDLLDSGY